MTPEAQSQYDAIMGAPDNYEMKQHLDKLVPLLIREGMERAAELTINKALANHMEVARYYTLDTMAQDIRQAAKEVK